MNATLTLPGAAISLGVMWANVRTWWTGNRDPKAIAPFAAFFLVGGLATVCVGGLLGWGAGMAVIGGSTAGDAAVEHATGTSGGPIAGGSLGTLTPEGACVVVLVVIAAALTWKAAGKKERRRMAGGAFCGMTLCATAGVAGLMTWLPTVVNEVGAWLRGFFEGAGVL